MSIISMVSFQLSSHTATKQVLQHVYERFKPSFEQLNARKAKTENWPNATVIELALITLKSSVFTAAYSPEVR